MSICLQEHLRKSALKTALIHLLKNKGKSPERTARNIAELLSRFQPLSASLSFGYEELVSMLKTLSPEEFISRILGEPAPPDVNTPSNHT